MTTRGHHRSRSKRKRKGTKKQLAHLEEEAESDRESGNLEVPEEPSGERPYSRGEKGPRRSAPRAEE